MTDASQKQPLLRVLRSRNAQLAAKADQLVRESHRLLEYTLSTFPGGTDHTPRHTATVEAIARMMLPDAFLAELTDEELFFLTVACHYHDLAMAGTEADDRSPETREQVRRDHAIRIGAKIQDQWAEFGFDNPRTAQVLGEICRGHRPRKDAEGNATWDDLKSIEILNIGVCIRVRLLSALIYAIDELHLGADRAPARVQSWRDIRDEESRRHWRRHQAVNGPARTADAILFQVNSETPQFEENLRAQMLRKALAALRDLKGQAKTERFSAPLPTVQIQWDRKKTWELLLPIVTSDLVPRSRREIEEAILSRYLTAGDARTDLSQLCGELGNSETELRADIRRSINDAFTCARLVCAPGTIDSLILATNETVAVSLFSTMRSADELDRLYVGPYLAQWENRLFDSPFGRAYVAGTLLPAIDRSYLVPLGQRPSTDPIRVVVETCPTAARLVSQFRPAPSNLVKEVLLGQAALSAALYDLHASPERLLSSELRRAIWSMVDAKSSLAPTIRLLEEMALVGGFTIEQVQTAQVLSPAAIQAIEAEVEEGSPGYQINLRQTLPADAPKSSSLFPYLALASKRSATPILLANAPGHDLAVQVTSDSGDPALVDEPSMVGFGPSESPAYGPVRLPARIEVDQVAKTIRFYIGRFAAESPASYPLIVRLPAPPKKRVPVDTRFGVGIQWPALKVRDLRAIEISDRLLKAGSVQVELLLEETGEIIAGMNTDKGGDLFRLGKWKAEVIRGLESLDAEDPAPIFVPVEQISRIGCMTASEQCRSWSDLRSGKGAGKPGVTSLYIRLTSSASRPVDEAFLRFFGANAFSPPSIGPGGTMSQVEFNQLWEARSNDIGLTSFFENDLHDLSQALREWCRDGGEFPFRIGPEGPASPLTRTEMTVHFRRRRDRGWHWENPVVFEFRHIGQQEAYKWEADYWRSIGDVARAELADEIRARMGRHANGIDTVADVKEG